MLKNDLSNKMAPILAFNFERVICEEFHSGFRLRYVLNKQNINAINQLYRKDFTILYATFAVPSRKLDKLEDTLDDVGCLFNGMMKVNDVESLKFFLRQHGNAEYFDTDIDLVDKLYPHSTLWQEHFVPIWNKEK